jgi:hypothetical protein
MTKVVQWDTCIVTTVMAKEHFQETSLTLTCVLTAKDVAVSFAPNAEEPEKLKSKIDEMDDRDAVNTED